MNIALIAHNNKKELMVQLCIAYCGIFSNHTLCSTSTTSRLITEATGMKVQKYMSRTQGGIQQIGFADGVLSFTDYGELEDEIPQEVKDLVAETTEKITNGEIEVPRIEDITND